MQRIFFLLAWTLVVSGVLITAVSAARISSSRTLASAADVAAWETANQTQTTLVAQPEPLNSQDTQVLFETADSRPMLIKSFIERYNKHLLEVNPDFHYDLVDIADRYEIDFRLLPAIAMKESGMCRAIPANSFNCLGLGVHSKGTWGFESYEANFDMAAKILKKNYIDKGLVSPEQIMTKYTPHSPNGEWAKGVNQFMSEMRYNNREKGIEEKDENNVVEFAQLPIATAPASFQVSISPTLP